MRCFIAIELSPAVQEALGAVQAQLRAALRDAPGRLSWVQPEQMHLTLRFFPDVAEDRRDTLQECLEAAVADFTPCTARCTALGLFPEAGPPQVVWVGCSDGREQVAGLERALTTALSGRGWDQDEHAFHPHITLGRVKAGAPGPSLRAALHRCSVPPALAFPVDHLTLIQSVLTPQGPRYTPLYRTEILHR